MQRYVTDTNILIYYLSAKLTQEGQLLLLNIMKQNVSYISVITRMELLGWQGHSNESLKMAEIILKQFKHVSLEENIIEHTIKLKQTLSLKLPDAIIAATALQLNTPLLTRNTKDFAKIPDLQLVNPFT